MAKKPELTKITFTLEDLYSQEVMGSIQQFSMSTQMPAAMAFRVGGLINSLDSAMKRIEPMLAALREKYGSKQPDGTYKVLTPGVAGWIETEDNLQKYNNWKAEADKISKEEVSVEFKPLTIAEMSGMKLLPAVMAVLSKYGIVVE